MFKAYFELLDPLELVDSLRSSNVNHCLSLVTIGCPQQPLIQWVIVGNLKFEAYFELLDPLQLVDSLIQTLFIVGSNVNHPCLSLVTIGRPQQPLIQWLIIRNLKFKAYFELLDPLQLVDNLITSNVIHCLSLVTIGCPQQPLIQWVIIGNLMFKAYFELLDPLQLVDSLRYSMIHSCLSLVTIGCSQ